MMGKVYPDPRSLISFSCADCGHSFRAEPARVVEEPSRPWHPWAYYHPCPACQETEAEQTPQEIGLIKAWTMATGPKSPEGKARSAANLAGHPTPEEALRTRFNAMRHGMRAQTGSYFPAKPGKYPECEDCDIRAECHGNVACHKKIELFMVHHIAFETRDPAMLRSYRANLHASIAAIIDGMIRAIIARGVELVSPQWYYDKDGDFHFASGSHPTTGETILLEDVQAHPLLKPLLEAISKVNLSLGDEGMTPRQQEENVIEMGRIHADGGRKESLDALTERQTRAMEGMAFLVRKGQAALRADPVLQEHQAADGGHE